VAGSCKYGDEPSGSGATDLVIKRSSCSSVSEEHLTGPVSICRVFRNLGTGDPIVETHCCVTMRPRITFVQE
jgi:hypothetical protein